MLRLTLKQNEQKEVPEIDKKHYSFASLIGVLKPKEKHTQL